MAERRKTTPEVRDRLVDYMMMITNSEGKEKSKSAFTDIVNQSENDKYGWNGYALVPPGTLNHIPGAQGLNQQVSMGNAVMVEDQGNDILNGLLWTHEEGHSHGRQSSKKLRYNKGMEGIYDQMTPQNKQFLDYAAQEKEMKSMYKQLDYVNNMMNGGYSGEPIGKALDDMKMKFNLFGEGLQESMGEDYNETLVNKIINWDRKGK